MQADASPDTAAEQVTSALVGVMTGLKTQMSRAGHEFAPAFVLYRVAEQEPVRVSDLAVSCGLDASTVSRHAKNLEDLGYVARSVDPRDRRASRIELTESGRAYLSDHMALRARLLGDALADWPADDRDQFLRLTQRLATSLAHIPTPTSSEHS
jgi:DNA-binding MarR family transcriptional regulator